VIARNEAGDAQAVSVLMHTYASPNAPEVPVISPTAETAQKKTALVLQWDAPAAHGTEIETYELEYVSAESDDAETMVLSLPGDATGHVVEGLNPAAVYDVRLRAQNAVGWGEWSPLNKVWTDPDKPMAPSLLVGTGAAAVEQGLTCASYAPTKDPISGKDDSNSMYILLGAVDGNGLKTQRYELAAWRAGHQGDEENPGPAVECGAQLATCANETFAASGAACSVVVDYGESQQPVHGLDADTPYCFRVRAYNALGWGPWADYVQCTTEPPYKEPFAPWKIYLPLLILLILCMIGIARYYYWRKYKLLPRLRKKEDDVNFDDYLSTNHAPMEDEDPEIVTNPVLMAKMQRLKELEYKEKHGKLPGKKATGPKSGGLARLGLGGFTKETNVPIKTKADQLDDLVNTADVPGMSGARLAETSSTSPGKSPKSSQRGSGKGANVEVADRKKFSLNESSLNESSMQQRRSECTAAL